MRFIAKMVAERLIGLCVKLFGIKEKSVDGSRHNYRIHYMMVTVGLIWVIPILL